MQSRSGWAPAPRSSNSPNGWCSISRRCPLRRGRRKVTAGHPLVERRFSTTVNQFDSQPCRRKRVISESERSLDCRVVVGGFPHVSGGGQPGAVGHEVVAPITEVVDAATGVGPDGSWCWLDDLEVRRARDRVRDPEVGLDEAVGLAHLEGALLDRGPHQPEVGAEFVECLIEVLDHHAEVVEALEGDKCCHCHAPFATQPPSA